MAMTINYQCAAKMRDINGLVSYCGFSVSSSNSTPTNLDALIAAIASLSNATVESVSVESFAVVSSPVAASSGPFDCLDLLRCVLSVTSDYRASMFVPSPVESMFVAGGEVLDITNSTLVSSLSGLLPPLRDRSGSTPTGIRSGNRTRRDKYLV